MNSPHCFTGQGKATHKVGKSTNHSPRLLGFQGTGPQLAAANRRESEPQVHRYSPGPGDAQLRDAALCLSPARSTPPQRCQAVLMQRNQRAGQRRAAHPGRKCRTLQSLQRPGSTADGECLGILHCIAVSGQWARLLHRMVNMQLLHKASFQELQSKEKTEEMTHPHCTWCRH